MRRIDECRQSSGRVAQTPSEGQQWLNRLPRFVGVLACCAVGCLGLVPRAAAESTQVQELRDGWKLISAQQVSASGDAISQETYSAEAWHPVHHMPATVLQVLQEDGVYPDLYYGMNLMTEPPQELYKQDWWYRTTFTAPPGRTAYQLDLPGINYRAEVWLNGQRVADSTQVVGMYDAHTLDVSKVIHPGATNALAIKVTPERAIEDVSGVELADSWFDWINWKYLGFKGKKIIQPDGMEFGISFVPDRNAGVWKPVSLHSTGALTLSHALVTTDLPLPRTDAATLTVYANLTNTTAQRVQAHVSGLISRPGKPEIHVEQTVSLAAGETREVTFDPAHFTQLQVPNPDLWWPYTLGKPNLYSLQLRATVEGQLSDEENIRFGIRKITQMRDQDESFPAVGKGGNFYLQVNGADYLLRGADYTPDLLFKNDPVREARQLEYVKDLGLNLLRWESKISSEHIVDLADEQGIPLMFGWMCCNQWEKWEQWTDEDRRVAQESMRSQINMLRAHASVFIWANGSDGRPPDAIRDAYHSVLHDLHWQNASVDTVSAAAKDAAGNKLWDGVHMEGPYSWRPPSYWFSGRYAAARGSCAEQGDNENVPPYESLTRFIPKDKLWPINEYWYAHAGSLNGNNLLANVQKAVNRRYGSSQGAEEFSRKSQLALYEDTRAQFEDFAANGWANHKMTMYWMLNSQWPSFFGHLFDYYMKPGGAYYGAKKGLRPLSVVFDYYAPGDHSRARATLVNQTAVQHRDLQVRTRIYDLDGRVRYDKRAEHLAVDARGTTQALTLPRLKDLSSTYFIRCELMDAGGTTLVDNVYWQSTTDDDLGEPANDSAFDLKQASWADLTALNQMPKVALEVSGVVQSDEEQSKVEITLHNPTAHIAFFERAEVTGEKDGLEILPIVYDDNYVTVFPGETVRIHGSFHRQDAKPARPWVRVEGENTSRQLVELH